MYKLANSFDWQGRSTEIKDEYIYQKIKYLDLNNSTKMCVDNNIRYALLGFCSDEGIRRNQGRIGAKEGPSFLRKSLSKLSLHGDCGGYYDAGDVFCNDFKLELSQIELGLRVEQILSLGLTPIVMGGGHETAWGNFLGLKHFFKLYKCAIINFDAHFVLRPLSRENLSSSGTPFYQINDFLSEHKKPFDYYCIGIQELANTKTLFQYADKNNVKYVTGQHINNGKFDSSFIKNIIREYDYIYLSICLDVFNLSIAPGVSSPQPLGIGPGCVIESLKLLQDSNKLLSMDIVELSPPYDKDCQTAKLGACLLSLMNK